MLKLLILVLLNAISLECLAGIDKWQDVVVVAGNISNRKEDSAKTITAIDCNPWDIGGSRHTVSVDSAGNFKTHVNLLYGHNFTIYYDGNFICQYAEPGDSIFVNIDAENIKNGASYSGSRAKFNNEYGKAYAKLFNTFFEELPAGKIAKDEYLKKFMAINYSYQDRIADYAASHRMGYDSQDLIKRSALFSLANATLEHSDETPDRILEFFADSIFGLDDAANLKEMMFPYHISAYLNRLEDVVEPESTKDMIDAIVSRHPKSLNRDVIIGKFIMSQDDCRQDLKIPKHIFSSDIIFEAIFQKENNLKQLPEIKIADGKIYECRGGQVKESKYSSISEILGKEYSGKFIYLDLWATWCVPCIIANKSLPELAEFFTGHNIVFVSVALKSNIDKWENLISNHPANCMNYFIYGDDDAELIMSAFKMTGFPSYRIIGPDGKIIDANAPRPNSSGVCDAILRLMQ